MDPKLNSGEAASNGLLAPHEIAEFVKNLPEAPSAVPARVDGEILEAGDGVDETDLEGESEESYEEGILAGLEAVEDSPLTRVDENSILIRRENTRSRLALTFLVFTFIVFILAMFIAVIDGLHRQVSIIDNLSEIIPIVSGVFLGSLGFVLGYYFRKSDEE